ELGGGQVGLADELIELPGGLEVDHQIRSAPSITPAARRSRYQRSTGCSLTYPWPPSSWTPSEPIAMPRSAHRRRASATSREKLRSWSTRLAARYVARRIPSSSIAMFATVNATACRCAIGSPNALRSLTYGLT